MIDNTLHHLHTHQTISVVRTATPEEAMAQVETLVQSGAQAIEITQTIPQANAVIQQASQKHPHLCFGSGTVLDEATATAAVEAGAKFLVSPVLNPRLVQWANEHAVLLIPGTLTPNEVYQAHLAGAHLIKVFPITDVGGPSYLQKLRAVFPQLKLIPTGGITPEVVPQYLAAGAFVVGVGYRTPAPR